MYKLFKGCILSPKDIGIEKYSVKEIANMMKPSNDIIDKPSLLEFANSVHDLLESNNNDDGLTNYSTGFAKARR